MSWATTSTPFTVGASRSGSTLPRCPVQLAGITGRRPVYAWIETSKGGQPTGPLENKNMSAPAHIRPPKFGCPSAAEPRASVTSLCLEADVQAIGVPEENREALRKINEQITRLTPAILGRSFPRSVTIAGGGVKLTALAKQHGGQLYIFAVNFDERLRKANATVDIESLPANSKVTVIDENREILCQAGSFRDTFGPLAVHIYKVPISPDAK